jgi:class 3 adenylate cyclase/tetratricopeptide (TPR) repeat protein
MLPRPQGIVTFLFTDIEGSTHLWEHHPVAMWEAFLQHERIIRDACTRHDGFIYKMIGDAFQVAFSTAKQALHAAVDAQRGLIRCPWGETGPLKVRMALHTGRTQERADDYVGPLLNRHARLLAAGAGGQILLSQRTAQDLEPDLGPESTLLDLGEYLLPDLVQPEHIFQVLVPDGPMTFPPLKCAHEDGGIVLTDQDALPAITPLPRRSRMPFHANPHFMGRHDALQSLAQTLQGRAESRPRWATVIGFGGIGKTSVAVEFVHRYGSVFAGGVFWLNFADPAAVPAEIAACGGRAYLNLHSAFETLLLEEQVALVQTAWQSAIPRLLVFDNCDDPTLAQQWAPTTGGCRLVITSRCAVWPSTLPIQLHPLDVFAQTTSIALLQHLAPRLTERDAADISEVIGDVPLALHLAGSFLRRYERLPIPEYVQQLRDQALLAHPSLQGRGMVHSPTNHAHNLERTFALSYHRLNAHDPIDGLALHVAATAACMAPNEPIPIMLLETALGRHAPLLDLDDALIRLLEVGFVSQADPHSILMHRLIHTYIQTVAPVMDYQPAVEQAMETHAMAANAAATPTAMIPLLGHLRWVLQRTAGRHDVTIAGLSTVLADYLTMIGDYHAAYRLYEPALMIRQTVLGREHPDAISSLQHVAYVLQKMGQYRAARSLYEEVLSMREQTCGPMHLDTATSLNLLAGLVVAMGDYQGAQPLYERALAIREQALGSTHPATARIINNLAEVFRATGNYTAARPLLEQVLAIHEQVLGLTHPHTALSLSNLAGLLGACGEYGIARELLERALAIHEQVLGSTHPDTGHSLYNLGGLWMAMGEYQTARPLLERALAIRERVFGAKHPTTARTRTRIAELLASTGDADGARSIVARALEIFERTLGPDHPTTQTARRTYASLIDTMATAT